MAISGVNGGSALPPVPPTQSESGSLGQVSRLGSGGQASSTQTGSVSQAPPNQASQKPQSPDAAKLEKALQQLNQMLSGTDTKVVTDPKAPPNALWLNVINTTTGAVIEHLPPEGLRQFAETASAKGLTVDLKF